LSKYLIPKDDIEKFVAEVRRDGYQMFRTFPKEPMSFPHLKLLLPDIEISALRAKEGAFLVGKTLAQVELRPYWRYAGADKSCRIQGERRESMGRMCSLFLPRPPSLPKFPVYSIQHNAKEGFHESLHSSGDSGGAGSDADMS